MNYILELEKLKENLKSVASLSIMVKTKGLGKLKEKREVVLCLPSSVDKPKYRKLKKRSSSTYAPSFRTYRSCRKICNPSAISAARPHDMDKGLVEMSWKPYCTCSLLVLVDLDVPTISGFNVASHWYTFETLLLCLNPLYLVRLLHYAIDRIVPDSITLYKSVYILHLKTQLHGCHRICEVFAFMFWLICYRKLENPWHRWSSVWNVSDTLTQMFNVCRKLGINIYVLGGPKMIIC